jgi:hypothetical protein
MLAQLRAYAALERRAYSALAPRDLPQLNFTDGLEQEAQALALRRIYLEGLILQDGSLDALEADWRAIAGLPADNEGWEYLLQNYKAELLLLKYNYLLTHFKFDDKGRGISEVEDTEKQLKEALAPLPPADKAALERRLAESQKALQPAGDTPSYDIIERRLSGQIAAWQLQGDFWADKKALDHLLDQAATLGGQSVVSTAEIMAAVNILYDLQLADLPGSPFGLISAEPADYPGSELIRKIGEFRRTFFGAAGQMPGFEFTPAEQGYGYYILLRLLNTSDAGRAALTPLLDAYLVHEPEKYYPESAVLITKFINEEKEKAKEKEKAGIKTGAEKEASRYAALTGLLPVAYRAQDDGSLITAYSRMGLALGNGDLPEAIEIAETAFGLPHGKYAGPDIAAFQHRYADWVNNTDQTSPDYQGYSAEKMLLELTAALIQQRAPKGSPAADKNILQLLAVLDAQSAQGTYVNAYYFELKRFILLIQCCAASMRTNDPVWNKTALQNYRRDLTALLERRLWGGTDAQGQIIEQAPAGEQEVITNILAALSGDGFEPSAAYALPEEALYLYAALLSVLTESNTVLDGTFPYRPGALLDQNRDLRDVLTTLDPGYGSLGGIKTEKSSGLSILVGYNRFHEESSGSVVTRSKNLSNGQETNNRQTYSEEIQRTEFTAQASLDLQQLFNVPLIIRGSVGLATYESTNRADVHDERFREGVLFSTDTPLSVSHEAVVPILGAGLESIFLRDLSLRSLTLLQANIGGGVGWSQTPQWRSAYDAELLGDKDTQWLNNRFTADAQLGAMFAPYGQEERWRFGFADSLSLDLSETRISWQESGTLLTNRADQGDLTNKFLLRGGHTFELGRAGNLALDVGAGYLFHKAWAPQIRGGRPQIDDTTAHGLALEASLNYFLSRDLNLSLSGYLDLYKEQAGYGLNLELTSAKLWGITWRLGLNFYDAAGSSRTETGSVTYTNPDPNIPATTVTNSSTTTADSVHNWNVSASVSLPVDDWFSKLFRRKKR